MRFDRGTLIIAGGAAVLFLLLTASASAKSGSTDLTGLKVGDRLRIDYPGHAGTASGDAEVTAIVPGAVGPVVMVKLLTGGDVGKSVPLELLTTPVQAAGGKVTRV
jgi:hypothetical protein